jgi:PIN domain nuclease of toxin-antitoxin system
VSGVVLDASAVLAFVYAEDGAEAVEPLLDGARISAVNWSEVLTKILAHAGDPGRLGSQILALGPEIEPFTRADAEHAATLYPATSTRGLSLGDRACLAVAKRLAATAVTADQAWTEFDHGVEVRLIRPPQKQRSR